MVRRPLGSTCTDTRLPYTTLVRSVVAEELAHRAAGIGREELQRSGLRRGRGDDDRIFHRAIFFELADDLCAGRALLADSDIDAIKLLLFVGAGVGFLLVYEGVDRLGGLGCLAIAVFPFVSAAA